MDPGHPAPLVWSLFNGVDRGPHGCRLLCDGPHEWLSPRDPSHPIRAQHGRRLHRLFSALFFLDVPLASVAFAGGFVQRGRSAWAQHSRATGWGFLACSVATTVAFLQVDPLETAAGLLQKITTTTRRAWTTLVALHVFQAMAKMINGQQHDPRPWCEGRNQHGIQKRPYSPLPAD